VPRPVIIAPYDPEWPRIYEEESKLIRATVGDTIRSLEHCGSTSVPGLAAKPIVDIIAGVDGREDAENCRERLKAIGYDDASPGDNPDWYYCLGKGPHSPGFHLHLVKEGSPHHVKHLAFRDWLRTHPEDARAYAELKINLAAKYRDDRVKYTESKNDFIDAIEEKTEKARTSRSS
jgi:GrpB-like predicted nucleotidyltransferase (UPF0157 family)